MSKRKETKEKKKENRNLKKITSTQAFSPIRDVREGIIITKEGKFVKLMEVKPINFNLKSADEQNAIISQFVSALRIMPTTVQFKVLTKKANPEAFIKKLEMEMQAEENEGCRKLQREQIELIRSVSYEQGVSRRFFLAFRFEDAGGFQKRPSFREIKAILERDAYTIQNLLEGCGNVIVSDGNNDEYILKTLYEIICRNESSYKSFEEKSDEVVGRYATLPEDEFSNVIIPVNDFIAPQYINSSKSPNCIEVDGLYYMFCYLPSNAYPVRALGGWLSLLINIGEGVDLDFWFHKEDVVSTQRKLQYKIRYNKIKLRETEDTASDFEDLSSAVDSGYYLKSGLASGEDFCYMGMMLTITAYDTKVLKERYTAIKRHLIGCDMKIKPCTFQQKEAFISSIPLATYDKGIWAKSRRNILIGSLGCCYPFLSYELNDENGILLGKNENGSLVFVDAYDTKNYSNANISILGSSGSGKTYALQSMALRLREKGVQVFLIAPLKAKEEFERACTAVGGTFIQIASGSGQNINIMEIRKKDDTAERQLSDSEDSSYLMQKIDSLHTFFSLLLPDLTYSEQQILDEALVQTYEKKGITSNNKSLYDSEKKNKYKKMPILEDLYNELETFGTKAERLHQALTRYVSGSARNFNQQTNVDLSNKYIVIDVSQLSKEMLPIGMFIALDYVFDKVKEDRTKRKAVIIDETWKLIGASGTELSAEFVLEMFKIIRGYGGSAICATQDLTDFFALADGKYGAGIINNSKIKMLMKSEPKDASAIAKTIDLTSTELAKLKKAKRGECLLIANDNHLSIKITTSKNEHDLITTDRTDLERIASERLRERG